MDSSSHNIVEIKKRFSSYIAYERNLQNVSGNSWDQEDYDTWEATCNMMVDIAPEFFIDRTMSGPSSMGMKPNIDGLHPSKYDFFSITARGENYKLQLLLTDVRARQPYYIAHTLIKELDERQTRLRMSPKFKNTKQVFYMPAIWAKTIDPNSFAPQIGFKLRVSYIEEFARVMRHDDMKIENAKCNWVGQRMEMRHTNPKEWAQL